MATLVGKVIDVWSVQEVIKCTPSISILKGTLRCFLSNVVCSVSKSSEKYCMTILYKDSNNPDYVEGQKLHAEMAINADVLPTFTYDDSHGSLQHVHFTPSLPLPCP